MNELSSLEISELQATAKAHSDPNETREEYILRMRAEGCEPSYPAENELQLDIDNEEQYKIFRYAFTILDREIQAAGFGPLIAKESPSRSGLPKRHIRIVLPWTVDQHQRIAWQAALGSDPIRELLSLIRCMNGDEHPTLLIEKVNGTE